MRALVLSDIHSLESVLAAAPPYDAVWNLGDIGGYGASQNEVVELARKLDGIVVRGNHDIACTDPISISGTIKLPKSTQPEVPLPNAASGTPAQNGG